MTRPLAPLFDIAAGRRAVGHPDLVASAVEHRMTGLLLTAYQGGRVPLATTQVAALVAADLATAGRHRQLWAVLTRAVTTLSATGIEAVTIKGVANEARWYSRLGERPCTDVDLVLAPHCVDRIDEVLAVLAPEYPVPAAATELVRRRQLQHVHFTVDGVTVDLHLDPLKLGIWTGHPELWWPTTGLIDAPDGTPVTVLAPEMALVSSLTHLNKDRYSYLGAYAEVARIAADPTLDWDRLTRFVTAEALDVPVWGSLQVVRDGLEVECPGPRPPSGWRRNVWERLWPPASRLQGHDGQRSARKRQLMIPLLTRDRWQEVAAEWRRAAFPSRQLIEVSGDRFADHSYLRRITFDRLADR